MFAASPSPTMEAAFGRLHKGGRPLRGRPPLWIPLLVMVRLWLWLWLWLLLIPLYTPYTHYTNHTHYTHSVHSFSQPPKPDPHYSAMC